MILTDSADRSSWPIQLTAKLELRLNNKLARPNDKAKGNFKTTAFKNVDE